MAGLTSLARDASALLDPEAGKPPAPGAALSRPGTADPDEVSLYHLVGRRLLAAATQAGRSRTALAAAEVFRYALDKAPADPSLHNGFGAALVECARLASEAEATTSLLQAMQAFQTASELVAQQAAPPAARLRYRTNLGMVLWMLGERTNDADHGRNAVEILRQVAAALPDSSPHWPHVQDNLGNALMAVGHADEAIPAYQAALAAQRVPLDRARSLGNLGTAYASQGRIAEACRHYREALLHQPRDQAPLAWARTQHNLGSALLQDAVARRKTPSVGKPLRQAIAAFEAAREERRRLGSPVDWAITTANLASAHVSMGVHESTRTPRPDRQAGADHIRRGVALYQEALPELGAADQARTAENIAVALKILDRLADGGGAADALVPPAGLAWPTETYAQAHKIRRETIVEFLTRVWLPFVEAGTLDLRLLRERDPSAAKGIDNYRRTIDPATGQRRQLPPHLRIPTKKELNDRLAARLASPGDRPARLDWALRARQRRAKGK